MDLKNFFKKKDSNPLGIEINAGSVSLVQLKRTGSQRSFTQFMTRQIPADVSKAEFPKKAGELIKSALSDGKFKKADVCLKVSAADCCIRVFTIPMMSRVEIPQAVKRVAKKFVAHPLEQMVSSYSVLGETLEQNVKKIQIVFVALFKHEYERQTGILKKAGLKPRLILPGCFAIWNLIKHKEWAKSNDTAIIAIGDLGTDISVFNDGKLVFARHVPLTEDGFFDSALASVFGEKDPSQAQKELMTKLIRKHGFESTETDALTEGISRKALWEGLEAYLARLIREVELSFSHYRQMSRGAQVNKVVLVGQIANLPQLERVLAEKLHCQVSLIDHDAIVLDEKNDRAREFAGEFAGFAELVGTCLEQGQHPNLLDNITSKGKGKKTFDVKPLQRNIFIGYGGLLFVWLMIVLTPGLITRFQMYKLKGRIEKLYRDTLRLRKMHNDVALLGAQRNIFLGIRRSESNLVETIAKLVETVETDKISLTQVHYRKDNPAEALLTLEGSVIEGSADNLSDVLVEFVLKLKTMKQFSEITPRITGGSDIVEVKESLHFTISCRFKKV